MCRMGPWNQEVITEEHATGNLRKYEGVKRTNNEGQSRLEAGGDIERHPTGHHGIGFTHPYILLER